ncbi:acyltransferase [Microbacterium murale]|uniref:Transferase n=1 Tax=Microbacterium murale TaxID=1081040 RepID=A0ABQ1RQ09_9MICO|nr:DapH/DapD/GlmU-related protein [Microbacterium murale]GGD75640.1 transferase [Microbacterium murale]
MNFARKLGVILRRHLFNMWINGFVSSVLVPDRARWMLLRASGIPVERSVIDARGFIGSRTVTIGKGSSLNYGVFLDGSAQVSIGRGVSIGMNALVLTGSHELGSPDKRAGELNSAPVTIEDGAWIGANAVILPGVTVGRGAVVGTGAIVMKDVAEGSVVMGNPARVVRRIDEPDAARA